MIETPLPASRATGARPGGAFRTRSCAGRHRPGQPHLHAGPTRGRAGARRRLVASRRRARSWRSWPERMRQEHAAGVDLRPAAPRRRRRALRPRSADAPTRSAVAVGLGTGQRGAGAARRRHRPAAGAGVGATMAGAVRAGRVRANPARQLSGGMRQRVSFLRSLLAASRCWRSTSRSPRSTRSPARDAGLAGPRVDRRAADRRAGHPRCRGGGPARRPRGRAVAGRPGRVVASIEVGLPRPRRRADPAVVALRERVLSALGVSG